ncbi:acid protease [Punctularia strigosozonata HHB-11173 SS5]|uniref:acid protease n=1 Tax=Punctularia strigosozonata (strain HHB-11173) TaxID=741275 RepID=UPI0004417A89|nr:acid protease [Punctularia strigosozonata HHB-11173 SS5]EIN11517.1 acid protease [Punctularia strigosozonata HHB-11173 SS5]
MNLVLASLIVYAALAQASPHPPSMDANGGSSVHLPMIRRNIQWTPERVGAYADHARAKYGYPTVASRPRLARNTAGVAIMNEGFDASYVAQATVGTPGKQFLVVLDTGSSDFWLPASSCQGCQTSAPTFDSSASSSFSTPSGSISKGEITIPYGSGQVSGTLGTDSVELAGFTVTDQTFLVADQISQDFFSGEADVSGIMGLAFESISSTKATPWWQTLVNNDLLDQPMMSFWLARASRTSSDQEQPGGVFTLGTANTSLFSGDIEYINQPSGLSASWWLLEMSKLTVLGQTVQISTGDSAIAAIDTGTTLIGGPSQDVTNFWSTVPGSQSLGGSNQGFWSYPCSTKLNATLNFGGRDWPISEEDMQFQQLDQKGETCQGALFDISAGSNLPSGSGNPAWIVGDTFLKNVYTVFRASNPPAVGFAELSTTAGGSGIAPGSAPAEIQSAGFRSARLSTGALASALFVLVIRMFSLL